MRLPPIPSWAPWSALGTALAAALFYAFKPREGDGGTWGGGGFGSAGPAEPIGLPEIPFVQAKHLGTGRPSGAVNAVVIHTAETPQTSAAAKNVANYFATTDTVASAHYTVDSDSIYQSVNEGDQAWHAAGYNARTIGIEHAGYAKMTPEEWQSDYNERMLRLSAKLAAQIATKYGIPAVRLSIADILAGKPGFAAHADASKAFKKSDHSDPGANFPWDHYLSLVQSYMGVS